MNSIAKRDHRLATGDVTVVGGGWSVANVAIDQLAGLVIAVNDSALHLPNWDIAVSMDRLWAENRLERVLERSTQDSPPRPIWMRRSAVQNLPWVEKYPWVVVFDCDHTSNAPSTEERVLNGTNSGACALNLAARAKPARLFLLGFDMNRDPRGNPYWYPPYDWVKSEKGATSAGKYNDWAFQMHRFADRFGLNGTEVFNVSPLSAIDAFPKITPAEYLKMTRSVTR
jgi:hypothetical protein